MAQSGHPHLGDEHVLEVTCKNGSTIVPLTGPVAFRLRRPDGTTFDVDADLTTDGTDGMAEYETIPTVGEDIGDLNQAGEWQLQLCDNGTWHADITRFVVQANLVEPTS